MLAAQIKHLMNAAWAVEPDDPAAALGWMAQRLGDTGDLFATAAVVIIDPTAGRLRVANAAHPAVLVTGGPELVRIGPTGPLLGPFEASWTSVTVDLAPDAMVVVHTDGLTEARDPMAASSAGTGWSRSWSTIPMPTQPWSPSPSELGAFRGHRLDDDLTIAIVARRSRRWLRRAPTRRGLGPRSTRPTADAHLDRILVAMAGPGGVGSSRSTPRRAGAGGGAAPGAGRAGHRLGQVGGVLGRHLGPAGAGAGPTLVVSPLLALMRDQVQRGPPRRPDRRHHQLHQPRRVGRGDRQMRSGGLDVCW